MADHVPVTLRQLQFFNTFQYRVSFLDIKELVPGITEFRLNIQLPAFSPLGTDGYIWLDEHGNMVANVVREKVSRPYPRDVNDPEHFRDHDFPIKVRMFPNWQHRPFGHGEIIEEEYPERQMTSLPGCPSALKHARDWIQSEMESEVSA